MLDKLNALAKSIPKDKLGQLLVEMFTAFNGAGYDLESMLDSSSKLSHEGSAVVDHTRALADDSRPILDAQAQTSDQTRRWARNLAGFTGQMVQDDAQFPEAAAHRTRLRARGFASAQSGEAHPAGVLGELDHHQADRGDLSPRARTAASATAPSVAAYASYGVTNNPTGLAVGGFALTIATPPACTVGFLPPSQWRSPADVSEADIPDNLNCTLPQNSPIFVRGARDYPCMNKPGKRAPTAEICIATRNICH